MDKEKFIEEANQIGQLLQSAGWKVIENEVMERKAKLTEMLIHADEHKTIRELQANIRGIEFLLKFPIDMLETAKRATAQNEP